MKRHLLLALIGFSLVAPSLMFANGDVTYPESYGVYACDKGVFVRLTDQSPGPEAEDIKHRTFSKNVSILIFEKWLTDPLENINAVTVLDWRSIGEHPMLQVSATAKPIDNHEDMVMIVSDAPFKPGLYMLQIGDKSHDYSFGVETPDIASYWEGVLGQRPASWQAQNHLGAVLFARGNVKGAYWHFAKAVELNPGNAESHNNLGLALRYFGQFQPAIKEFQAAVKIKECSVMYTNLADAYEAAKRYDDAIKAYRHAILLDYRNSAAFCNLGYALMQQGKIDDAIVEWRKALELDPDMPQAKQDLKEAFKGN